MKAKATATRRLMIMNSKKDASKQMPMCPFVGCLYIARKKGSYEASDLKPKTINFLCCFRLSSLTFYDFISNTVPYFTA